MMPLRQSESVEPNVNMNDTGDAWLNKARKVLDIEIAALEGLKASLGEAFVEAVRAVLDVDGRLVVVGMGKSGIIAKKIAATFASTGTPAFFVHAAEAQHGDLGMITGHDAVIAISHSGETAEVCGLLPEIRRRGARVIAMTGNPDSTLAAHADITLHVPVEKEACPMNLAPTASTTATLALGDALAVVVLKQRGFREEDFARVHPAGSLGRRLLKVSDVMHRGEELPLVAHDASLRQAVTTMSSHRLGITGIIRDGRLIGCLSDGDLRRILESGHVDMEAAVEQLMHPDPAWIEPDRLASDALRMMEKKQILALFVCGDRGETLGIVHMHDLLKAGIA